MIEATLGIVKDGMKILDVPYAFMRWTSEIIPNRYWIGEFTESPTNTEDGYENYTIILTGTTNDLWSVLMEDREKIKDYFTKISGLRMITGAGAVVIFYDNAFPVPTGDANLKRMQINLQVKTWKGM